MKHLQIKLLAGAVLATLSHTALAQQAEEAPPRVVVTASPLNAHDGDQILAPARVLAGEELRLKLANSLGETLANELGVSSSAFGPASSRPIIRGLEGSRVKMLENGMSVADVSGLSNDHAVASDGASARQIEILRGPAALLYGSGAIGGLVNVVNERIPTALEAAPSRSIDMRFGTVDQGKSLAGEFDHVLGKFAFHADGSLRNAHDYKIAGPRNSGDPASASGRLPFTATRGNNGGVGASYIDDSGYIGASVGTMYNRYGAPTPEGSLLDQEQTRYDIDLMRNKPLPGFSAFKFKAGHTDYQHAELALDGTPETRFTNKATETRWELAHEAVQGWTGTIGLQTESSRFAAVAADGSGPDTVAPTKSQVAALFVVEERHFGEAQINAGARYENVKRTPEGLRERSFNLQSYSAGARLPLDAGHAVGLTVSFAQRAPAIEELYSNGPHDSTATYDIGSADLRKETSRNIDLSVSRNVGSLRWKLNLFQNKIKDFVYGHMTGRMLDDEGEAGGELHERLYQQANATISGAEAELTHNWGASGWSQRVFADTARGRFDAGGNLPLQAAQRIGADLHYKAGPLRGGVNVVHAFKQDRLASFETRATPAYTRVDAQLSYSQRVEGATLNWFLVVRNLLNEEIRVSTSVLKDVAPQPGRNLVFGVRAAF